MSAPVSTEPTTCEDLTLGGVEGLAWLDSGQAVLFGALLSFAEALDRMFVRVATRWSAHEYRFPTFIPAAELDRVDYFRSFPHLATFPACLEPDEANLDAFCRDDPVRGDGAVQLTTVAPVRDVLTPAACYHLYVHHKRAGIETPRYSTTANTCFRRETHYRPLERLWTFTMREIVCMGTPAEVHAFLAEASAVVDTITSNFGLAVTWTAANDPFFRAPTNPKFLMQKIDPTKRELVFDGRLAIASANFHHDHFGRAFDITRATAAGAEPVHSGCVAFGIERWLAALAHTFGPAPAGWPDPDTLAVQSGEGTDA